MIPKLVTFMTKKKINFQFHSHSSSGYEYAKERTFCSIFQTFIQLKLNGKLKNFIMFIVMYTMCHIYYVMEE